MWIITQVTIILGTCAFGLWMYCIVVQLENISQQLNWMREAQERYNVRDR